MRYWWGGVDPIFPHLLKKLRGLPIILQRVHQNPNFRHVIDFWLIWKEDDSSFTSGVSGVSQTGVRANPRGGDTNLLFGNIFAENCIKMKEIRFWVSEGVASLAPLWIRQCLHNVGFLHVIKWDDNLIWSDDPNKHSVTDPLWWQNTLENPVINHTYTLTKLERVYVLACWGHLCHLSAHCVHALHSMYDHIWKTNDIILANVQLCTIFLLPFSENMYSRSEKHMCLVDTQNIFTL